MMKLALSPCAAGLLRALIARANADRSQVLLSDFRCEDWQSLTFVGERHEMTFRIVGANAADIAARMVAGIADDDLPVPGHIVADAQCKAPPEQQADGSWLIRIEALTIEE